MSKTTAAAKVEKAAAPASEAVAPKAPEIKPANVQVNDAGQVWRSVLVRMSEGAVDDDLRDPKIWRLVQGSPFHALLKMDQLLILGFDESWGAEAIVKHASPTEARLMIKKVFGFSEIGVDGLFTDGTLEVFWDGASFGFRRVTDKVPVARGFSSEGQAIDALRRHYPKKVG
jgi:hypothetical protein